MIGSAEFVSLLQDLDVEFYTGVPDSLLKSVCAYIQSAVAPDKHVITANEGNAVALAIGRYLATGKFGLVYLQNSGLGNAINPLVSLADPDVYSIPMCLLVGWRGEPGVKDEPQHVKQGRISQKQLETLEIPYEILDGASSWQSQVRDMLRTMREQSRPVALLARSGTFADSNVQLPQDPRYRLSREAAIASILNRIGPDVLVVASTGHISREVYEIRIASGQEAIHDFLTVGGMGHTASIALGLSLARQDRRILCLDGDGSLIMHMGMLPIIGTLSPPNLVHVVMNNGAHDSVGGQPTVGFNMDVVAAARACGYRAAWCASSLDELETGISHALGQPGPLLLDVRVAKGARKGLGRPKSTPAQNKHSFMVATGVYRS